MNIPHPSMTATIMAFHRALEMLQPEAERVCHDPLAIRLLPQDWASLLADREQLMALMGEKARQFPGVNGAIVSRVRFIDDVLTQLLTEGLEQVAILGAGYDSRAYRIDGLGSRVAVYELDDPITQQDKRTKLEAVIGAAPAKVTYVVMDFASDVLRPRLSEAGFDFGKKSLFIMEGLVPYISREAFSGLLESIAEQGDPVHDLVFDYLPPAVVNGTCEWVEGRNMYREVIAHGETFRLGFENREVKAFLEARGYEVIVNANAPDLKPLYFKGRAAQRPVTPVFWFVHARTTRPFGG